MLVQPLVLGTAPYHVLALLSRRQESELGSWEKESEREGLKWSNQAWKMRVCPETQAQRF